ncbi:hypothetical protein MKX03_030014 [Papaver bracteatum]|nr:hypothetical protein MKX03_030014 [Papaver bracteatum]
MRAQSRVRSSTSGVNNTHMQDTDLETYYRRLIRRNECIERQVGLASLKHPKISLDLSQIAEDYKDTESDEDFYLNDTSSRS